MAPLLVTRALVPLLQQAADKNGGRSGNKDGSTLADNGSGSADKDGDGGRSAHRAAVIMMSSCLARYWIFFSFLDDLNFLVSYWAFF